MSAPSIKSIADIPIPDFPEMPPFVPEFADTYTMNVETVARTFVEQLSRSFDQLRDYKPKDDDELMRKCDKMMQLHERIKQFNKESSTASKIFSPLNQKISDAFTNLVGGCLDKVDAMDVQGNKDRKEKHRRLEKLEGILNKFGVEFAKTAFPSAAQKQEIEQRLKKLKVVIETGKKDLEAAFQTHSRVIAPTMKAFNIKQAGPMQKGAITLNPTKVKDTLRQIEKMQPGAARVRTLLAFVEEIEKRIDQTKAQASLKREIKPLAVLKVHGN